MGYKSRGNFKVVLCMKFDCKNRDKLCKECVKCYHYEVKNERPKENSKDSN